MRSYRHAHSLLNLSTTMWHPTKNLLPFIWCIILNSHEFGFIMIMNCIYTHWRILFLILWNMLWHYDKPENSMKYVWWKSIVKFTHLVQLEWWNGLKLEQVLDESHQFIIWSRKEEFTFKHEIHEMDIQHIRIRICLTVISHSHILLLSLSLSVSLSVPINNTQLNNFT